MNRIHMYGPGLDSCTLLPTLKLLPQACRLKAIKPMEEMRVRESWYPHTTRMSPALSGVQPLQKCWDTCAAVAGMCMGTQVGNTFSPINNCAV
eukprot:CAMPEP_0202894138 /NCGR_PEP_ID=MMETSP1392-20130828/3593_1 /ASSEMBLY_ACC=CAM_ASM_000868 /TAXON_ID=225041 /ORGANISM="Chlamydomonas chlamydogama, Strain SAG 11-48b" /LENGTH=92 /DNA_ID=CAMNT_0049578727 /DNA_START=238 /DNA_END=516 /DNA_ORIENTATION=+